MEKKKCSKLAWRMESATGEWMEGWSGAEPVSCSGESLRRSAKESSRTERSETPSKQHLISRSQTNPHLTFWPNPKMQSLWRIWLFLPFICIYVFIYLFFIFKHKSLAHVGSLCTGFFLRPAGRLVYSTTLILKVTRPRNLSLSSLLRMSEPSTLHSTVSSLL